MGYFDRTYRPAGGRKSAIQAVAADPDDNKYIEAAVEGLAQFVVTGDRHLLSLKSYENIRIVTPRVFLELL